MKHHAFSKLKCWNRPGSFCLLQCMIYVAPFHLRPQTSTEPPPVLKLMTRPLINRVWALSKLSNAIIQAPFMPLFNYS